MLLKRAFENQHFVIIDKDAGMLSTPARFQDQEDRFCLGTFLQKELKIQIFPVHRLDFEVSGLVIYAKTAEAHRAANLWFERKEVSKTYRALSVGPRFEHLLPQVKPRDAKLVEGLSQEWKCRLLRGKKRAYESPHGKDCLTLANYAGSNGKFHQWDLNPVTGRSHQLRFEMSRHGHPIVGDSLYGSSTDWAEDAIALRAYKIDFSRAPQAEKFQLPSELLVDIDLS